MDFYTVVLKKSGVFWLALCLENGVIGQDKVKEKAIDKLKEAVDSLKELSETEDDIDKSALSIQELHEFLSYDGKPSDKEAYELRALSA